MILYDFSASFKFKFEKKKRKADKVDALQKNVDYLKSKYETYENDDAQSSSGSTSSVRKVKLRNLYTLFFFV